MKWTKNDAPRLILILLISIFMLLVIAGTGITVADEPPSTIYLPLVLKGDRSIRGSNEFGYQMRDNRLSDELVFEWIEIEETGTELEFNRYDSIGIPLPFYFPFYDYEYNHVIVRNWGNLVFGRWEGTKTGIQSIQRYPQGYQPGLTHAYFQHFVEPKRLVVEFKNIAVSGSEELADFEVIIYESGDILLQYLRVGETDSQDVEVKIQTVGYDPYRDPLVYPDIPRSGDVVQFKFPDEPNHAYPIGEEQWFSDGLTNVGRHGQYTDILIDPQEETVETIFLSTDDGTFLESTDAGKTWTRRSHAGKVRSLAPDFGDSGVIFSGSPGSSGTQPYMNRSHNRGKTFSEVHGVSLGINDIAYSPTYDTDQTLVAAGSKGVWFSTDEGLSWQLRGVSTTPEIARDIQFSPDFDTDGKLWVMASQELYRSTDSGWHWGGLDTPEALLDVAIAGSGESVTLFIVTEDPYGNRHVWRSTDDGDSWESMGKIDSCLDSIYPSIDFSEDHTLYAHATNCSTSTPLYRSLDGGTSWHEFHQGIEFTYGASLDKMTTHPRTKEMFAIANGHDLKKLYRRAPADEVWVLVSESPPPGTEIVQAGIAQKDDGDLIIFVKEHRSEDSGEHWSEITGLPEGQELAAVELSPHFEQDGIALALTDRYRTPGGAWRMNLLRTTDGGLTWVQVLDNAYVDLNNGDHPIGLSPTFQHDQTGFLALNSGVWRTQDGGVSWQQVRDVGYLSSIVISPDYASDQTVFAQTQSTGSIIRSTDGGETWEANHGNGNILSISPSFADDQMLFCCKLERSTDAGDTWEEMGTPNSYSINGIVVSEWYQGNQFIAITNDRGETWQQNLEDGSGWSTIGLQRFISLPHNQFYNPQNDELYELNGYGLQWRQMNWR